MRISDWSSDVCSSDLRRSAAHGDLLPLFLGPDGETAGTGSDRVGVPRRQSADQPDTEGIAAYRLAAGAGCFRDRLQFAKLFAILQVRHDQGGTVLHGRHPKEL